MSAIVHKQDLDGSGTSSVRFEHPELKSGISAFLVDVPKGRGPKAHAHPYAETFFIHSGRGEFTVDGKGLMGEEGDVVVVHPGEAHQFVSVGDEPLRMTCIHASDEMRTDWV